MPGRVVTPEQWREERIKLLAEEKALTKKADELAKARENLPMVKVSKEYKFTGPNGAIDLADIFQGSPQLVVYHTMWDPEWETPCKSCNFMLDQMPKHLEHLHARNTTLVTLSRNDFPKLEAFKKRMGWDIDWYSSVGSDFNYDFHATHDDRVAPTDDNFTTAAEMKAKGKQPGRGEQPGFSIFLKEGDEIYHTYSCYARGLDNFLTTYKLLDLTPLGRQDRSTGAGLGFQYHDGY